MALQLKPGEYKGYQKAAGKHNNSGPCGRRKTKPIAIYRRAQAKQAKAFYTRLAASLGFTWPIRIVYWT